MSPVVLQILLLCTATVTAPTPRAYLVTQAGPYDGAILAASVRHGLDPFVLRALLEIESELNPRAINPRSGARGIAQFSRGGRAAIGRLQGRPFTAADALTPARAIPAAAMFLVHLEGYCGGREPALAAWNTGKSCRGRKSFIRRVLRRAAAARARAGLPPLYHRHERGES